MYKIGEFSKLVDMPVRTLRYYDEINILKPGYVDVFTGYRYYTEENLSQANLIKILRSVGFSLEEILLYKDNLNEEVLDAKVLSLEEEKNEIDFKIRKLEIIKNEILSSEESLINDNVITLKKSLDNVRRAA